MKTSVKNEDYEPQFQKGAGSPKVRREINRINRVVARMLKAGIPKRDVDFLVRAYERSGENMGSARELERQMLAQIEIEQRRRN